MDWHSMNYREICKNLDTDIKKGLSSEQVNSRLEKYGKNTLTQKKKQSVFMKFLSQFKDFMVLILLIASGISFATAFLSGDGDFIDPVMILIIVILNAVVGTVQECRAEKAIDALKKLSAPHTKVIRNGRLITIPSDELVKGDIISFESGDLICADCRIIESSSLKAEESALTGESVPSDKHYENIFPKDTPIADRNNMLFSSTFITSGHGKAVVVETGMDTQVGKIAEMIDSEETPDTPLQKSLAKTGRILGISAVIICVVIFVLGIIQKIPPLEMFMISISLAVAAIPEGLPAVVTIVLALGVRKMALHRAIIRHLPAVETLGSASVICSDKTGTLTQNKMTVVNVSSSNGTVNANSADGIFILSLASLCNNSVISGNKIDGDPTETAIVTACANAGKYKNILD
ncbi:MAG: HAD-IC family P-type ATPase, partial [Clostridia bacterium]|nr:HAD-IC family P-type ATPase [Clostridia bacterium]